MEFPRNPRFEEAYQESVKQWHPDLYENYASLRADAEERFKQIQVAYRELKEHNTAAGNRRQSLSCCNLRSRSQLHQPYAELLRPAAAPALVWRRARLPDCVAIHAEVEEMVARPSGKAGQALAIVDLGGTRSHIASYSQFLLIANRGIMVRDARNIVSLLWYKDLGELTLDRRARGGKPARGKIHRRSLRQPAGCQLQIYRSNGRSFFSLTDQVDDSVKKNFVQLSSEQESIKPDP